MTGIEIRPPELAGGTTEEQLGRVQRYLCTLAQQLQYAFDAVEGGGTSVVYAAQPAGTEQNFSQIKSLILKSAQITAALEERVEKRLEGKYVAESQFGTFRQETSQTISANSRELRQQFESMQQLTSHVEELDSSVRQVSATIRTGEIADGVYGVEIGQQEGENGVIRFRRYARLTARKLSFYDSNEVEVAYISDRCLYVTAANVAEITTGAITAASFRQGDYTWQLGADGHLSLR